MDKGIAALIGAAALTTMAAAPAVASTSERAPATNYRELLDPVPNALSALKADDARLAGSAQAAETAGIKEAQYYRHRYFRRHHHHHHHHRF